MKPFLIYACIIAIATLMHVCNSQACSPPSNLLAWYKFENNISDTSVNALHGSTLSPSLFTTNGAIGSALQINSTHGFFKVDNFTFALSGEKPQMSICFWLLPTLVSSSTQSLLYIKFSNADDKFATNDALSLSLTGGRLVFGTTTVQVLNLNSSVIYDNSWHHYCLVVNLYKPHEIPSPIGQGTVTQYKFAATLYIDGLQNKYDLQFSSKLPSITVEKGTLFVGASSDNGNNATVAQLDELFIFTSELSDNEVATLASRQLFCCGLNSTSAAVCNGRGSCTSYPNKCSCASPTLYTGNNCEIHMCSGIAYTSANTVCSGHGSCIGANTCSCGSGWKGFNCEFTECANPFTNQTCSNRGTCQGTSCTCTNPTCHMGNVCEFDACEKAPLTTVRDAAWTLAGFDFSNYTLQLEYGKHVPLSLQRSIKCSFGNEFFSAEPVEFVEGNRRFYCSFQTGEVGIYPIRLHLQNNILLSSSTVFFTVIRNVILQFHNSSLAVVNSTTDLAPVIDLGYSMPDASKVFCRYTKRIILPQTMYSVYVRVPATPVSSDNSTFSCLFVAQNKSAVINFALVFNNSVEIYIAHNFLAVGYYIASTISHDPLSYGGCAANQSTSIGFKGSEFYPSSLAMYLSSHIGGRYYRTMAHNSVSPTSFNAIINHPVPGLYNFSVWLQPYALQPQTKIPYSLNTFLFGVFQGAEFSSIYPFAGEIGKNYSVTFTLEKPLTPEAVYQPEKVYYTCGYRIDNQIYYTNLTKLNTTTMQCNIHSPPTQQTLYVNIYAHVSWHVRPIPIVKTPGLFDYWEPLNITTIMPFVDTFTSIASKTVNITVTSANDFLSSRGLMCVYNDNNGIRIESQSIYEPSTKSIKCPITKTSLTSTETTDVSLVIRLRSDAMFQLSVNNCSLTLIPGPVSYSQKILAPDATLICNFLSPLSKAKLSFFSTVTYYNDLNVTESTNMPCNAIANQAATCNLQGVLPVGSYPQQLASLSLSFTQQGNPSVITFALTNTANYFYSENATISSEFPFIGDPSAASGNTFEFTGSKNLNSQFPFFCRTLFTGDNQVVLIPALVKDNRVLVCNISSYNKEQSIQVHFSTIIDSNYVIATTSPSVIRFGVLQLSPSLIEMKQDSVHNVVFRDSQLASVIPARYANKNYTLQLSNFDQRMVILCSLIGGALNCSRPGSYPRTFTKQDIQLITTELLSDGKKLLNVQHPFVLYTQNSVSTVLPRAALAGQQVNVAVKFFNSTLDIDAKLPINLYCQHSTSPLTFAGSKEDANTQLCAIPANYFQTGQVLYFNAFAKFSTVSNATNATLSVPNTAFPLYVVEQASTTFVYGQDQVIFFYTASNNYIPVTLAAAFPSEEVKGSVKCRLYSQLTASNNYLQTIAVSAETNMFNCSVISGFVGKSNLSLWYSDERNQFQYSSNSLELIFAQQSGIVSIDPFAARTNRTNTISLVTQFNTLADYGSASFFCNYEGLEATVQQTKASISNEQLGVFLCNVSSTFATNVNVSISMRVKSTERVISTEPVLFSLLDSYFLEPSHGLISGNEAVSIRDYTDPQANVVINNDMQIPCTKTGSNLACVTPSLASLLPFNSYEVSVLATKLAIRFVVYDKRDITVFPSIIPTTLTSIAGFQISLNSQISTVEGSISVSVAEYTLLATRYEIGAVRNTNSISFTMNGMPEGSYPIHVFYKNNNLLAVRRSVLISNVPQIRFVQPRTISFVPGTSNIGYVNSAFNVTIQASGADLSSISSFVVCQAGALVLPTFIVPNTTNTFACTVNNANKGITQFKLVYKGVQAIGGQFDLSVNSLNVVFADIEEPQQILPHLSISNAETVTITLSGENVYADNVLYECRYSGLTSALAVRLGNTITCTLQRFAFHSTLEVLIFIAGAQTGVFIPLTNNKVTFFFSNQLSINDLRPFAIGYTGNSSSSQVTILTNNDILTSTGLFCKYTTVEGMKLTPFITTSRTSGICNIAHGSLTLNTTIVPISLWMNTSVASFDYSNLANFMFINENSLMFVNADIFMYSNIQVGGESNIFKLSFEKPAFWNYPITYSVAVGATQLKCNSSLPVITCELISPNLNVIPIIASPILSLYNPSSGVQSLIQVKPYFILKTTNITQMYPYVFGAGESTIAPKRVVFDLELGLLQSSLSDMVCEIKNGQDQVFNAPLEAYGTNPNTCSCMIKSFGATAESVSVTLRYKQVGFSSNAPLIRFVHSLPVTGLQRGIVRGGATISVTLPEYSLKSTSIINAPMLNLVDRGRVIPMLNCSFAHDIGFLSCVAPRYISFSSTKWFTKLTLTMNSLYAMQLTTFLFFAEPTVTVAEPYIYDPNAGISSIKFTGLFQMFTEQTTFVQYTFGNYTSASVQCIRTSGDTEMKCPAPTLLPDYVVGNISMVLTYVPDGYTVTIPNVFVVSTNLRPVIDDVQPKFVNVGASTVVRIHGSNLLQSGFTSASVIFYDDFLSVTVPTMFINNSLILVPSPLLYDEKSEYPRVLGLKIKFGTGFVLDTAANGSSTAISVQPFAFVSISPSFSFVSSKLNNMQITNFPSVTLKPHHTAIQLRLVDTITQNTIPLNCDVNFSLCNMTLAFPNTPSLMILRAVAMIGNTVDSTLVTLRLHAPFTVLGAVPVITSVFPKRIIKGKTKLRFIGSNIPSIAVSSEINVKYQTANARNSLATGSDQQFVMNVDQFSTNQELSVAASSFNTIGNFKLTSVSFNKGFDWVNMNFPLSVVDAPQAILLENAEDNNQPTAFTFKRVTATIRGSGFIDDVASIVVRFTSSISTTSTVFTAVNLNLVVVSNIEVVLDLPQIEEIIPAHIVSTIRYPFAGVKLEISFNEGSDFNTLPMIYLNKYRAPLLVTTDTRIFSRSEDNIIVLRGNYFVNVTGCILTLDSSTNMTVPITPLDQFTAFCEVAANLIPKGVTRVFVAVQNSRGELSLTYPVRFYSVPEVVQALPGAEIKSAGDIVDFLLKNMDLQDEPISIRFGQFGVTNPCTIASVIASDSAIVKCKIAANEVGLFQSSLTYNRKQYHPQAFEFRFLGCKPGWFAPTFADECTPCAPGLFKSAGEYINGTISCFECPVNTFASSFGSTQCTSCPPNTKTLGKASTLQSDCGCLSTFMLNPNLIERTQTYCITCPIGANCTSFNTTVSKALPGYWFSSTNKVKFDKCNPVESCPGGLPEQCSYGYTGDRCGKCLNKFWKFKGHCTPCSGDAPWRFVVLVIILSVITLLFFTFSSIKVRHVTSASIAFGFAQVISMFAKLPNIKFPSTVDSSVSAFSVFNFNYDFISLECVFPITYEIKWALSLSIPYAILASFILLFSAFLLRSVFARIVACCIKLPYVALYEIQELAAASTSKAKLTLYKVLNKVVITPRNLIVWFFTKPSSRADLSAVLDKCINGYCTFVSFVYTFVMVETSEVFNCTRQADGRSTLNASPDIYCYEGSRWFVMMPIAVTNYVLINGVMLLVYGYIFLMRNSLGEKNAPIRRRFKFVLQRFRAKFWFWDCVITLRKTFISILIVMFQPMNVIVLCIGLVFVGLILQMKFVPYKKKFHNLMDYFVLVLTLIALLCGLLFYVDKFPSTAWSVVFQVVAMVVIITCTVLVGVLIAFDIFVRRDKETRKRKQKRLQAIEQKEEQKPKKLTLYDDKGQVTIVHPFTVEEVEDEEDAADTLNKIISEIFSWHRFKHRVKVIKRKTMRFLHLCCNKKQQKQQQK